MLRLEYFPSQWKCAEVIMLLKPSMPGYDLITAKILKELPSILVQTNKPTANTFKSDGNNHLKRITAIIQQKNSIPDHQFGFRKHHSTIEHVNRVYSIARNSIEEGKYCTAVFIDVSQVFDNV